MVISYWSINIIKFERLHNKFSDDLLPHEGFNKAKYNQIKTGTYERSNKKVLCDPLNFFGLVLEGEAIIKVEPTCNQDAF